MFLYLQKPILEISSISYLINKLHSKSQIDNILK